MTALSDRLNEARGTDGLDTIVRRAENKGHKLDRSAFARAFNGDHAKKPRDATLRAWAAGLDIDVNELRRLCRMPEGEMGIYTGPDESARLNRDQRRALDRLIKTIVDQKEVSRDAANPAEKSDDIGIDVVTTRDVEVPPADESPRGDTSKGSRRTAGGAGRR